MYSDIDLLVIVLGPSALLLAVALLGSFIGLLIYRKRSRFCLHCGELHRWRNLDGSTSAFCSKECHYKCMDEQPTS